MSGMGADKELDAFLLAAGAGGAALGAGWVALRVTGHEAHGVAGVIRGMASAGPLAWGVAVVVLTMALVAAGLALRAFRSSLGLGSAGGTGSYRDMGRKAAIKRARTILADSLPAGASAGDGGELVRYMGSSKGRALYMQFEDPEICYAVTRSGKTRLLVARRVLEAPGAVLATSTKVDGIAKTWKGRLQGAGGRTMAFDPMSKALGPVPVRWDPVLGCRDFNVARGRGRAFAMGGAVARSDDGNTRWFVDRGAQILGYLFHAAALAGQDITAVHRWVSRPEEAIEVLRQSQSRTARLMVATLNDLMVEMADETASGFKGTMQGALEPVMIDSVLEALTPPAHESFDAEAFARSKDALWVLSPETEGAVASVTTMFVDHVVGTARRMSDMLPGQRLTPPLSLVLDEAANVAPLPDLDAIFSEGPGRGVFVSAFFQDWSQVVKRWGEQVAQVVFQQARALYALGGSKDSEWNERLANLTAEFEETRTSYSHGPAGGSTSTHTERRHRLREADVAKLPYGTALLAPSGHDALTVKLVDIDRDAQWGSSALEGQRAYDERLRVLQQAPPDQRALVRQGLVGWMGDAGGGS